MQISKLNKRDIEACSKIVGQNYSKEYRNDSKKELGAMFNNPVVPPKYLVAKEKNKVLGFAGYIQSWMDYHVYQIFWVNVRPDLQHGGIGTALVKQIIKEIKRKKGEDEARLILLTTRSPTFYKRLGFRVLTKVKKSSVLMVLKF